MTDGRSMDYYGPDKTDNKEFMMFAINIQPDLICYASDRLRNNKGLVKKAMLELDLVNLKGLDPFQWMSKNLRLDRSFMLELITENRNLFDYLHVSFKNSPDFILSIIDKGEPDILSKLDQAGSIRNDRSFMKKAVALNPLCLLHLNVNYVSEVGIVKAGMFTNAETVWSTMNSSLEDNPVIWLETFKSNAITLDNHLTDVGFSNFVTLLDTVKQTKSVNTKSELFYFNALLRINNSDTEDNPIKHVEEDLLPKASYKNNRMIDLILSRVSKQNLLTIEFKSDIIKSRCELAIKNKDILKIDIKPVKKKQRMIF